jgi:hypothetical protein
LFVTDREEAWHEQTKAAKQLLWAFLKRKESILRWLDDFVVLALIALDCSGTWPWLLLLSPFVPQAIAAL